MIRNLRNGGGAASPPRVREAEGKQQGAHRVRALVEAEGKFADAKERWLQNHGFWPQDYPTTARLSVEQFKSILKEGVVNVSDVIVD